MSINHNMPKYIDNNLANKMCKYLENVSGHFGYFELNYNNKLKLNIKKKPLYSSSSVVFSWFLINQKMTSSMHQMY